MKKIIDEKMNSKHYWDYMYETNGIFGNGYSQWSTFRRLGEISKHIENNSRVADLFAGAGTLEYIHGPYNYYFACDWSESGLELTRADKKIKYDVCNRKQRKEVLSECKNENIDWIVLCGAFMLNNIINNVNVFEFLRECLSVAKKGVIANFGSDESIYNGDYSSVLRPSEVIVKLDDLKPTIIQNYLPHEYLLKLEHPKKDWR